MKHLFFTSVICLFTFFAFSGQNNDFEYLKDKYGEYNAVITRLEYDFKFDVIDGKLQVSQTDVQEIMILNDHAKMFTNDYFFYGAFTSVSNKEAYSLIPEGNKYRKIEVENFKESHDRDGSVFYDDTKTIRFSYPSVQKGAKTFLSYTVDYKNPRFLRKSFLQSYLPVINGRITAKVHKDIKIGYKLFNNESGKVHFKQYQKGKYNYYEWDVVENEPFQYAAGKRYSISYYSPHVALYVDETNINGSKENYFGEVSDLYHFYSGFIQQVKNEDLTEFQQLVDGITQGLSDNEKVKAIYYWVQQNIKYLAYEQGYMGFLPSAGSEVFKKRFGDCKGMSSIIKEMMRLTGVEGYFSWVGTRDIPYTYEELPLPSVDNHMIATYLDGDSVVLLDATVKYLDYGVYPDHLQGKEVLISLDSDHYRLFKVPVAPVEYSSVVDSISLRIEGNSLHGEGHRMHKGYNKIELARALTEVKEKDIEKRLSQIFNKGNNKFMVDSCSISDLFEHDKKAKVNYGFSLPDYCRQLADEIYLNMDLDKNYKEMKIDTSSLYAPIENDFYFTERFIYSLEIPDGYRIDYVPEGGSFNTPEFGYKITYTKKEDKVIMEKLIRFEFLLLKEDKFEQWNKMIKQLNKHYRSTVALKKIQ